LDAYERRAAMPGWDQERYIALLEAAKLREQLDSQSCEVLATYLRAHDARPCRAEALCYLARYSRERGEYAAAWVFAAAAVQIPRPDDILFVDEAVYAWRALDEYAVAAYWTGRYHEAADANRRLLESGRVPECEHERLRSNLGFCLQRLPP
jgi:tetratricopeptide (TPR) repeat protein